MLATGNAGTVTIYLNQDTRAHRRHFVQIPGRLKNKVIKTPIKNEPLTLIRNVPSGNSAVIEPEPERCQDEARQGADRASKHHYGVFAEQSTSPKLWHRRRDTLAFPRSGSDEGVRSRCREN